MPPADPPPTAPERLARIIEGLCLAIAARGVGGRLTSALLMLLWNRLRGAAIRVRRLDAKIAAGKSLDPRRRLATPRPARPSPLHLPRGFAWVVRWAPATAACASQLQFLLADPEMAALAATPPMRRLLRPLCRMLGVPPPPVPKRRALAAAPPPIARKPPDRSAGETHDPACTARVSPTLSSPAGLIGVIQSERCTRLPLPLPAIVAA